MEVSTSPRNACAYLWKGGKASSESTSMYMYVPPTEVDFGLKTFFQKCNA